jgi:hypothetical protein
LQGNPRRRAVALGSPDSQALWYFGDSPGRSPMLKRDPFDSSIGAYAPQPNTRLPLLFRFEMHKAERSPLAFRAALD